jgi:hypothetical protein
LPSSALLSLFREPRRTGTLNFKAEEFSGFGSNVKERTGMKKSRFTEEQIIGIVKQHEAGVKTADLCREHQARRIESMVAWGAGRVETES